MTGRLISDRGVGARLKISHRGSGFGRRGGDRAEQGGCVNVLNGSTCSWLRRVRAGAVVASLAVSTLGVAAGAPLTYVSGLRTFTTWVGIGPVTFETRSTDFNPLIGWTRLDLPNGSGQPDSTGYSSQNSVLNADGITMSGTVWGIDGFYGSLGSGGGTSTLNVVFNVSEPSRFTLSGFFHSSLESSAAEWYVSLIRDDIGLVFWHARVDAVESYLSKGSLDPGQYRLVVYVTDGWFGAGAGSGSCNFDVSLSIAGNDTTTPVSLFHRLGKSDHAVAALAIMCPPLVRRRRHDGTDGVGVI